MELVLEFLKTKIKLSKNDNVVVGVSGGPDSMCLLYILLELKKAIGFQIIVAHINHNVRTESIEEEQFLKDYSLKNKVIFESMKIEKYNHTNFHKQARDIRYKFYYDLVNKYNAAYLMTAHHGDDLVETILMRLVRGSTLNGYKGITLITKLPNFLIVRPLLYLTKDEIETFNKVNNIPYRIDKSNYSSKYTRNRYRKNILPFLKEENKNVHLKFLKFSSLIDDANNYIEKVVDNAYNNIYKDYKLDIPLFKTEDIFIQKLILERILTTIYDDLGQIESKHIDLLLDLIRKNRSGSRVNLPNSVLALIDYNYLIFKKEENKEINYCYKLEDGLILPNGMKFVKLEKDENGNDTLHIESSKVKLPLYVRNKRSGDKIELKGLLVSKKVSDIFINSKVSRYKRDDYPVVVDSSGKIIWIPKIKKSKYDSQNKEMCDIIFKCL